jgi:cobalt/nickel transport protein
MTIGQRNLLLVALAVVLAGIPTLMALGVIPSIVAEPQWAGGDGIITDTVGQLRQGYEPWFQPFFAPSDYGIEPIMFGLQALIGSGLTSFFLGWLIGRRTSQTGEGNERRNAMIVSGVMIVIGILLLFVKTELGELQAFIAALQGLALGTLFFFLGYPMGRKAGVTAPSTGRAA